MRPFSALAVLLLFSTLIAHAQGDNPTSRNSLRGIKGIALVIEGLPPEVEQNGLTGDILRTDVELMLQDAGIPLLPKADEWLYVMVSVGRLAGGPVPNIVGGYWPYIVAVSVQQPAFLKRDSSILAAGTTTWALPARFGTVAKKNLAVLRGDVKDKVGQFISAYWAANPKP